MKNERTHAALSAIEENMRAEYIALLPLLTSEERASFEENVTPEFMSRIGTWLGTREEIEHILFWDRGGKYEDSLWKGLEPVDQETERLFVKVGERLETWRQRAVESQLRSDLTLYSQFNDGLLFTGLSGAVRCDKRGEEDRANGGYFRGIELRCIGSVEDEINFIRILPLEGGAFEVHLGSHPSGKTPGMRVYSGDSYALLQLEKLISRDFSKAEWQAELLEPRGNKVFPRSQGHTKVDPKGRSSSRW